MTDIVNVPREAVVAAIKEADRPFRQTLSEYRYRILAEAALAAAPKADGMDAYTSDDMLNLISDEQARHLASSTDVSLVRARLKDILNAQLGDKSRRLNPEAPTADDNALLSKPVADKISHDTGVNPEAPKVEQEPVARVVSAHGDPEAFGEREIEVLKDLSGIPYDTPLYTSAPASDELLEALRDLSEAVLEEQARLFAAAPEMKEALIEARRTIIQLLYCDADFKLAVGSDEDWVGFIDAALAKANGEAPQ